jgi:hypothetical protein
MEDIEAGNEIFIPGAVLLVGAVVALLFFSLTRVIKYVKLLTRSD